MSRDRDVGDVQLALAFRQALIEQHLPVDVRGHVRGRDHGHPRGDGEDDLDPLESIGSEEHQYEVSEDRAVLAPGFRALDERERKILQLRFFDGLTQSQIAQQVGISQMHVSRLIRRALEKIRQEIAVEDDVETSARSHG